MSVLAGVDAPEPPRLIRSLPSAAEHERTADGARFVGVHLLTLEGGAIAKITAFMDPSLASRFAPDVATP